MKIYHLVAASEGGVIGKDNKLPWHFPADLKYFKKMTLGSTVIMGRKTFESIGKPLPGRENFVLSRSAGTNQDHLYFFKSFEEALEQVKTEKVFIIGGAMVYWETINKVDGIYFTKIKGKYEGDAIYPEIPPKFKLISSEPCPEEPKLEFQYYERLK